MEREDEFDIHPIEEIHKRRLDLEDEAIDALTIEPTKGYSDEDGFRMPVLLDIDDSESEDEIVAIGPGTMRRRSPGEGKEWTNGTDNARSGDEKATRRTGTTSNKTVHKPRKK